MFRLALACTVLCIPLCCVSETLSGRVIGVTDGDTVVILENNTSYKVRLVGIDAPEKTQPYGQQAKKSLSDLVFGQQVNVEWKKTDRYERRLGKVSTAAIHDVNLEQIHRGMAWHYRQYQSEQSNWDRLLYAQAENEAKEEKRGLWRSNNPLPPWDYRKDRRQLSYSH